MSIKSRLRAALVGVSLIASLLTITPTAVRALAMANDLFADRITIAVADTEVVDAADFEDNGAEALGDVPFCEMPDGDTFLWDSEGEAADEGCGGDIEPGDDGNVASSADSAYWDFPAVAGSTYLVKLTVSDCVVEETEADLWSLTLYQGPEGAGDTWLQYATTSFSAASYFRGGEDPANVVGETYVLRTYAPISADIAVEIGNILSAGNYDDIATECPADQDVTLSVTDIGDDAPDNDSRDTATDITEYWTETADLTYASIDWTDPNEWTSIDSGGEGRSYTFVSESVWYAFVPSETGDYHIDAVDAECTYFDDVEEHEAREDGWNPCEEGDWTLALYDSEWNMVSRDDDCGYDENVETDPHETLYPCLRADETDSEADLVAGDTYYIQVTKYAPNTEDGTIELRVWPVSSEDVGTFNVGDAPSYSFTDLGRQASGKYRYAEVDSSQSWWNIVGPDTVAGGGVIDTIPVLSGGGESYQWFVCRRRLQEDPSARQVRTCREADGYDEATFELRSVPRAWRNLFLMVQITGTAAEEAVEKYLGTAGRLPRR